jgi:ubiquinone biosynthesis protein
MIDLFRHPRRAGQILAAFATYFLLPRLGLGAYAHVPGPVRLRLALERLGGAWVKFGQMLAMRLDLLPAAYCDELFRLLNSVEPFAYEQVQAIVRDELGDLPEAVFASFEPRSFAAASIGQVHRASLRDGTAVAVKVQRPGIRDALEADIRLMSSLAFVLDRTHIFGATSSRTVIEEFARWTADELDYLLEARQAILMHEHADASRVERIARVYRDLSTSRVLTTELIEGVPLIDVVVASRDHDGAYLDAFRGAGHDLHRIVLHLDWNMLNQVFVFGYFHADLHPANLIVLPGDAIGYVDFGIVGRLSDRVRESLKRYSRRLFDGKVELAIEELLHWLTPTASTDAVDTRRRLVRVHEAFLYEATGRVRASESETGGRAVDRENPYLRLAMGILDIIREEGLSVSGSIVAYLRMLVTLGTIRHQLAPDYDIGPVVRRFFRRQVRQESMTWLDPRLGLERLDAASARVHRAIAFLEFVEEQEPVLRAASESLTGVRGRVQAYRRRLVRLGIATLVAAIALYVVLADPSGTRAVLPQGMPYDWVHLGLLGLVVVLVVALVMQLRRLGRSD